MSPSPQQVDALFERWNRTDSPGCVLGVIQSGKLIYQRAYGMADLERDVPLKPESVFDIGSTGKQFAAMQIALLAHRGLLALDDPVQKYIPELPDYGHPVTIRHLLHHTSGLRDYLLLLILSGQSFTVMNNHEDLLALICRQRALNFVPGEEFAYSNTGYVLLGLIASRVTQTPYPDLLRATFFEPLEMTASDINDDPGRIMRNRALSYSPGPDGGFRSEAIEPGGFGDGPILSTVRDLVRWDRNFYDNRLGGGQDLVREMTTSGRFNDGSPIGYGLGLFTSLYRGLPTIHHGGAWAGYRAELIRFPEQHFSVVCLANLGSMSPSKLAKQVADLYLAEVFTEATEEPLDSVGAPPFDLATIAGHYQNPKSRDVIELAVREGEVSATASGYPLELAYAGDRRWRVTNLPYDLSFDVVGDPDGEPEAARLILHTDIGGGRPEECVRVPGAAVTEDQLAEVAGRYRSDELSVDYDLSVEAGQLHLRIGSTPPRPLQAIHRDLYLSAFIALEVVRGADDRISGLKVSGGRVRNVEFTR